MRLSWFALLLAAAAGVVGWTPPRDPDVAGLTAYVERYYRDSGKLTKAVRSEIRRHAVDAWEASAKVAGRYGYDRRRVFRVYADVAMVEGRFRVRGVHDGGEGLGPVSIQMGELDAAANRAGLLRRKASEDRRRKLHERAWSEPTLIVWLSVDHVAHRIWKEGGSVRSGALRNHCGVCEGQARRLDYLGALLVWHEVLWDGEQLPASLRLDRSRLDSAASIP